MAKLTKRKIDATKPDREVRLWDDDPRGLGIRIKPAGVKTFFVQYKGPETGTKERHGLGQYGRITLDPARREARKVLGWVAAGEDPAKKRRLARKRTRSTAATIAELCDDYLRDAKAGLVTYRGKPKKASTLQIDEGQIRRHIVPLLGHKLARDLTSTEVERFMHDVHVGKTAVTEKSDPRGVARVTGGATTAARTASLMGAIFS